MGATPSSSTPRVAPGRKKRANVTPTKVHRNTDAKMTCVRFSPDLVEEIIDSSFHGRNARRPTFYIKYGPPGSGKGGIMSQVVAKDKISEESLVTVDVDRIVEANPVYIARRRALNGKSEEAKSKLYWKYRKDADRISDRILNRAIINGFDVAWETTGRTIAWTKKEIRRLTKQGYSVTVVYPLVPVATLIARATERESKTGQTPAPKDSLEEGVRLAIKNLMKLIDVVDNVYVYDNSGKLGQADVVVEVNNVWAWTSEDSRHGPGMKRTVKCACDKISTRMATRFSEEILLALNGICECSLQDAPSASPA